MAGTSERRVDNLTEKHLPPVASRTTAILLHMGLPAPKQSALRSSHSLGCDPTESNCSLWHCTSFRPPTLFSKHMLDST